MTLDNLKILTVGMPKVKGIFISTELQIAILFSRSQRNACNLVGTISAVLSSLQERIMNKAFH